MLMIKDSTLFSLKPYSTTHAVRVFLFLLILGGTACGEESTPLFTVLNPEITGVEFSNDLHYTEDYNPYTYRNFYNGGGVALGDINND